MKRNILIFIGIIVGIYLVVSVLNYRSEYNAEVYLFKANKILSQILQSPQSTPPHIFKRSIDSYKKVIEKFPGSESAKRAILFLGQVCIINNQPEQARLELNKAISQYTDDKDFLAEI